MFSRKQSVLASITLLSLVGFAAGDNITTRPSTSRFREDDPLWKEPKPLPVKVASTIEVDKLYDFVDQTFVVAHQETKARHREPMRAQDVNTLGEVPDSEWYTNRHERHRMTIDELVRGAGNIVPEPGGQWQVTSAKSDGVTPGFRIRDGKGNTFLIKLDPVDYPDLASAPEAIGSKFFYALGYNTPDNNIVYFNREQLTIPEGSSWKDAAGRKHALTSEQIDRMLKGQPRDNAGKYRAIASRWIAGKVVGPFMFEGTRADDPNDIVPHEYRRELRGMELFEAWLNNTDSRAYNTLDSLIDDHGTPHLVHYIIDWGSALGSNGVGPKDIRRGHDYVIDPKTTLVQAVSFGFYLPDWMRTSYPSIRGVGKFDWQSFDALHWHANYPVAPFLLMDDEDAFWAAKKVMAFTDAEVRAIVQTAAYTNPRATDWITECLIHRRDKIGAAWLSRGLALDNFRVQDGRLKFDDLAEHYKIRPAREYSMQWSSFDNQTGASIPVESGGNPSTVPVSAGRNTGFLAASIRTQGDVSEVVVYLRHLGDDWKVVGLDRRYK